jgi:glycerophosphoryl diester phosphodiesterase
MLATTAVITLARFFVPQATASLALLAIAVGVSLLVWAVVSLAVNLLSMTTFAALHINIYRSLGCEGELDTSRLNVAARAERRSGFQFTRKRLFAAGIVGAVIAVGVGVSAMRSVRLDDDVEIMAHRGSSAAAPENTMAAVRKAIEEQADWVEIDVQETADGEVVVFHDSDFMKLAGVDLKIWNATQADLAQIDIGSWFGAEFKNERVPTLGQVLDQCKGKIGVNIELKYYGHDRQLEERVVEIVETHGMSDSIVTMSLKIGAVRKMRSLRPNWRSGLLMSVVAGDLKRIDADFLAVNAAFVDRSLIRDAHHSGKQVYVWTVNDAASMSSMIGRGVDGLITDKPALARSVLEQRATMSAPERLLVELADNFGVATEIGAQ